MKFIFILIVVLFFGGIFQLTAQRSEAFKLKAKSWNLNENGTFKFVAPLKGNINHPDSPIILNNRDTITRYVFKKFFFTTPKIPARNYIAVLIGTDSKYTPLLVVDKNFDNSFSDDSVYKFSTSRTFANEKEFYESLPSISVDSLKIGPSIKNRSLSFKLAPYFRGTKFLNDKNVIKSAKKYALAFYATNYLSSDFVINKQLFEFAIIPHPLSFPIYNQTNVAQGGSRWSFVISKINQNSKGKYIDWGPYQKIVDHLKDTSNAISILNKYLLINSISLDSGLISVSIIDSINYAKSTNHSHGNLKNFTMVQGFCLNNNKWMKYDFSKEKLSLVEFSGSWCVPCAEALPDLKMLYKKYSAKMHFVSIMEEQSKSAAQKYFMIHKLPWMIFYEDIAATETVKTRMNNHIFPSFFLVNQKGEIIYKHIAAGGMEEIERKIKDYLQL